MKMETFSLEETAHFLPGTKITDHYTFNGRNVPRVTDIISACMHEEAFMQWANRLGFQRKDYNHTLQWYADYGTEVHEVLEKYIRTGRMPKKITHINPVQAFENWWKQIKSNNKVKVLGQEFPLTCQYYGGTYDMLLEVNGEPLLVDFKTSNHISCRYFYQLAAYKYMLELEGTYLQGVIVLQLDKEEVGFNEYLLDFSIPNHRDFMNACTEGFFSLVYAYYRTKEAEARYNNIF